MLLERYRSILIGSRRRPRSDLAVGVWGYLLGLLSTAAFTSPTLDCVRNHRRADFRGHDNVPDGVQAGQTTFSAALSSIECTKTTSTCPTFMSF